MIDGISIMEKLNAYAQTPAVNKKMKQCLEHAQETGKPLASGERVMSLAQMTKMANALIAMIQKRLPESIAQVGNTLVSGAPIKNRNGSYTIILSFDSSALFRESLENDEGYEGIDNIVALFNNGYHAKKHVYGWWNGRSASGESIYRSGIGSDYAWIQSKKERDPLQFMQDAESEFNNIYGTKHGVTVKLGSVYTTK